MEGKRAKHDTLGCEVEGTKFPGVFKTLIVLLTAGDPTGQFITTKSAMDKLLGKANGSLDFIKKELSIPKNAWNEELMRVDVHNPLLHNARFPSGFERGANELFKWGGYTKGGMPEIVVDQFPIGGYSANTIGVKP